MEAEGINGGCVAGSPHDSVDVHHQVLVAIYPRFPLKVTTATRSMHLSAYKSRRGEAVLGRPCNYEGEEWIADPCGEYKGHRLLLPPLFPLSSKRALEGRHFSFWELAIIYMNSGLIYTSLNRSGDFSDPYQWLFHSVTPPSVALFSLSMSNSKGQVP